MSENLVHPSLWQSLRVFLVKSFTVFVRRLTTISIDKHFEARL